MLNSREKKVWTYSDYSYGTPVWSDMVSATTTDDNGKKSIPMKSTGHEKSLVLICLAATADGKKLKPMTVFKGA